MYRATINSINLFRNPENLLYHYTSISALMDIVESRKLRATNLNYMNDAQEIKYGLTLLRNLIDKDMESTTDVKKSIFLAYFKNWLSHIQVMPHHIFAISLTKQGNLLSQWRGYTEFGKGVSIAFDKERLFALAKQHNFKPYKCDYKIKSQINIIKSCYDDIKKGYENNIDLIMANETSIHKYGLEYLNRKTEGLLIAFSQVKDTIFDEEDENRLLSRYFPSYIDPAIKFKEGRTTLVPYIELDISGMEKNGPLFEEVIVGPSSNIGLAVHSIQNYLSNKRVCNVVKNRTLIDFAPVNML